MKVSVTYSDRPVVRDHRSPSHHQPHHQPSHHQPHYQPSHHQPHYQPPHHHHHHYPRPPIVVPVPVYPTYPTYPNPPYAYGPSVDGYTDRLMGQFDHNRDGYVGPNEKAWADHRSQRFLEQADRTGYYYSSPDGYVSRQEMRQAVRDRVDLNWDHVIDSREQRHAMISFGFN